MVHGTPTRRPPPSPAMAIAKLSSSSSSSSSSPHSSQLFASAAPVNAAKKSSASAAGRDVKQRTNYYVNKLGDRDTEAMAVAELESMARALPAESLSPFLSAISDTRPSDKSPLRRHCLRLLSLLSRTHSPSSISPFLPRMIASVLRRLRDPDSSVRAACVDAVRDMVSCCSSTTASFCVLFLGPLSESLLLERDHNAQMGSAMCLAAAVEAAPALDDDLAHQLHRLLPRLVKLARSEGFKAKPALLTLLGSIVAVGGATAQAQLDILVPCLANAISSDDWAARKAASEALTRVAAISDFHLLSGFRSSYFSSFQARRYDKVKIVRETMNQMLEAWKGIPGVLGDDDEEGRNTSSSRSYSSPDGRGSESGSRVVAGTTRNPGAVRSTSPHTSQEGRPPIGRSPPTDLSFAASGGRRTSSTTEKRKGPPILRNLEGRKTTDWKAEISIPRGPHRAFTWEHEPQDDHVGDIQIFDRAKDQENPKSKMEAGRPLLDKNSEKSVNRLSCLESGSPVVNGNSEQTVETDDLFEESKDNGMSLIREQLIQIENQQSTLLDLVQRFIGNSHDGICSLETRVLGLEIALNEMSYDMAMCSGRMSRTAPSTHCCRLPGAEFLSSKLWRRSESRFSSRYSPSGALQAAGLQNCGNKVAVNSLNWEKQGLTLNSGFLVNPLAKANFQSRRSSFDSSAKMRNSCMFDSGSQQADDSNMIEEASTVTTHQYD